MIKVEKVIAQFYIFCLPLRMIVPLSFLQKYIGGCALSFDVILHGLGMILWIVNPHKICLRKEFKQAFAVLFFIVSVFTAASVFNAAGYHEDFGILYGEDSFMAIRGQILYWFQYLLIIVYNIRVFRLLDMHQIWKIINIMSYVMLFWGYLQMAVIVIRNDWICRIYDMLANDIIFLPSTYLLNENRIVLTTTEPAYAGYIIIRLILPIILSDVLFRSLSGKIIVQIVLWLPVIYFTKSSNAYILTAVELLAFTILLINKVIKLKRIRMNLYSAGIALTVVFLLMMMPFWIAKVNFTEVSYFLLYKITDRTNMSTVWRTVPFYINWEIFKRFPFLGVGNGNQGFFYWEYFPQWAYELLQGTQTMKWNSGKLTNGLLFFPGILSGYGILGVVCLVLAVICMLHLMCKYKEKAYREYYFFVIAMAGITINGFSADFVACYDIWFTVSLPFCLSEILTAHHQKNRLERGR